LTEARESSIRCFVALTLPDPVRAALERFARQLSGTGARVSWVRRENLHLTLQFLGEVSVNRLDQVFQAADAAADTVFPFEFVVEGAGFFGSVRSPRVAWAGVADPPPALHRLQLSVAQQLAEGGFVPGKQKFESHITLGRIRESAQAAELTSQLASANNTAFGVVPVNRLVVLQSHLEPSGVLYSILHESKLKGKELDGQNEDISDPR
jgi:2'-5' RNA ligase